MVDEPARQTFTTGIGHAPTDSRVPSQVKELRSALGISQEQMAKRLGVSFATVNRWETGRRSPSASSRRLLVLLAATLGRTRSTVVLVPPTTFIGREAELCELEGLLKVYRLLTLAGPGGSGKTRLAMELIRRSPATQDPVALVALDMVSDPAMVPSAVCGALGLRDIAGVSPDDQVIAYLATRFCLLVLDNCEHVIDGVRRLVSAAMDAAPQLRVLITSRTVLDVGGEQVWVVPPLGLPRGSAPADVEQSDAGRLFVTRVTSRRGDFSLDRDGASAVARVCRALDGLPLALELAAAWSAVLSPTELAERLEDSLSLLDLGAASGGRHATLRAAVEWSDALLDPLERDVLGQVSVFVGRFTLPDAEAVTETPAPNDVIFALRRLVDSSWVVAEHTEEETTTYGLLNTLRAYARGLLERSGQAASVYLRHARAMTDLAEMSEGALAGPEQARWRAHMERATGDIQSALEWAVAHDEIDLGLRLVGSLWRWWYTTGRIVEGRRWAQAALKRSRRAPPALRARALYTSAILASENGDYGTAAAHGQAARREFQAVGDHGGAARASTVLGNVAKYRGNAVAARARLTEAVASQRALGDDRGTAVALQNLAALVIDQAELHTGRELMEESLALKRRAGDGRSLGYGLINLSDLLIRELTPDRARAALAEAAAIAISLNDDRLAAFVDHNLGDVAVSNAEHDQAAVHYRRALAGFRRVHDRRDVALALCSLGRALLAAGQRPEGLALLHESESLAIELGDELRLSETREALAAEALPPDARSLPGGLSSRQAEVLGLVAAGLSNRDVATRLNLAAGTVERHLANIYRKINVANRVAATRYALAHGLGAVATSVL